MLKIRILYMLKKLNINNIINIPENTGCFCV